MVRAKFRLDSVTNHSNGGAQSLKFYPVSADGIEENQRFHKYTPSGELTMYVDNPPAQSFFKIGHSYYLDFTEAEQAKAAG